MLLKRAHLEGIVAGRISVAFRRWKRPTVKAGGFLHTQLGVLAIRSVRKVEANEITAKDAARSGFGSLGALLKLLNAKTGGALYRVELGFAGEDPRIKLRQRSEISEKEIGGLKKKLDRMDASSRQGPWTRQTLGLLAKHPGKRAADLADELSVEKLWFKQNVRKLKNLGLTESLPKGYRLSPRGRSLLEYL